MAFGHLIPTRTDLGSLVREHRERLDLSLREAANDCGIPFSTLARIERGDGVPTLETFVAIMRWLNLREPCPALDLASNLLEMAR